MSAEARRAFAGVIVNDPWLDRRICSPTADRNSRAVVDLLSRPKKIRYSGGPQLAGLLGGIERFNAEVLPLMKEAGLRVANRSKGVRNE